VRLATRAASDPETSRTISSTILEEPGHALIEDRVVVATRLVAGLVLLADDESHPARIRRALARGACAAPACAECWGRSRDGAAGFLRARQSPGCRGPTSGSAQSRDPKPRPRGSGRRRPVGSPGSRAMSFHTCQVLRPRWAARALALTRPPVLPSAFATASAPGI